MEHSGGYSYNPGKGSWRLVPWYSRGRGGNGSDSECVCEEPTGFVNGFIPESMTVFTWGNLSNFK